MSQTLYLMSQTEDIQPLIDKGEVKQTEGKIQYLVINEDA